MPELPFIPQKDKGTLGVYMRFFQPKIINNHLGPSLLSMQQRHSFATHR